MSQDDDKKKDAPDEDRTVIGQPLPGAASTPPAEEDDPWGAPSAPPAPPAPKRAPPPDEDRTQVAQPLPGGDESPFGGTAESASPFGDPAEDATESASPFGGEPAPDPDESLDASDATGLSLPPADDAGDVAAEVQPTGRPDLPGTADDTGLSGPDLAEAGAPEGLSRPPADDMPLPKVPQDDTGLRTPAETAGHPSDDGLKTPGDVAGAPSDPSLRTPGDVTGAPSDPALRTPGDITGAPSDPALVAQDEVMGPPREDTDRTDPPVATPPPPDVTDETGIEAPPAGDPAAEETGLRSPPKVDAPDDSGIAAAAPPPAEAAEPGRVASPPSQDGGKIPIGTMINNNYEIKELISAGGMGEVFRGENAFTGDAVAIKIVLQSLANDSKIAALFMREAKVLCNLSDPGIVRYFNFVRDADLDRFCLIMEFISGQSLSDHVRDVAPLTDDEAKGVMRRVASGLEKAHQMEVVHRDLSPDNVMLRDGKVSDAVLIDFGIAKSTEMAEQTLHGQLAGKFKYISPEQLGHFGGEIGPRTDIYGLGLLMAAALRGEPIDMGSSVVEAVNARREIPDLDGVSETFRPLLAHMLEPDPKDRPARMSDVIRLIDHPEQVPAKYGGPVRDPHEATSPPTGAAPGLATPGLRAPPGTQAPRTMRGVTGVPGDANDASASPFGPGTQPPATASPVTYVPGLTTPPGGGTMSGGASRGRRDGEGGGAFRWILALLLILAVGGYVAARQGMLPPEIAAMVGMAPEEGPEQALPDEVTDTPSGPMTRSGFLAGYDAGECAYAERIAGGRDAGTIETFALAESAWDGLADDYEAAFETRPTIRNRTVPETQCAVLAMARSLQRRDGSAPVLTLDSAEMQSGGSIVGRLSDRRGRPVWLVLVTAAGGVYNLTSRMEEQPDGSATFAFGLNADGSGQAQPNLIMAVASESPLIAAAAANNGARASDLLPLIEAEIAGRDGAAGAALGYFELLP